VQETILLANFSSNGKRRKEQWNFGPKDYRGAVRLFPTKTPSRERTSRKTAVSCAWSPQFCHYIIGLCTKVGDVVADMFCGTGEMGLMAAVMCRSVYYVDNNDGALLIAKQLLGTLEEAVKKSCWSLDDFLGFEPTDGRPCNEEVVRGMMTEERRAQRKLQRELNETLVDIGHSPVQGAGGPEQPPASRGKKGKEAKGGQGDQPVGEEEDEDGDGDSDREAAIKANAPPPPKEKPAVGPAAMEVEHPEGEGDDSAKPVEAAKGVGGVEEEEGGGGGEGGEGGEGGGGGGGGE
jgi:hypothetical protein